MCIYLHFLQQIFLQIQFKFVPHLKENLTSYSQVNIQHSYTLGLLDVVR